MASLLKPRFFFLAGLFAVFCCTSCGDSNSSVTSMTVYPINPTIGIRQSQAFTVIAKNILGNIVTGISPTWSTSSSIGSISSTGLFTAGSASGGGSVVAVYGSITASSTVAITEKGWIAGRIFSSTFGYVPDMKVYLKINTALQAFSDTNGNYSIANVPAGTWEVDTDATSVYLASSQEVTVASGETASYDIFLQLQPSVSTIPSTTLPPF